MSYYAAAAAHAKQAALDLQERQAAQEAAEARATAAAAKVRSIDRGRALFCRLNRSCLSMSLFFTEALGSQHRYPPHVQWYALLHLAHHHQAASPFPNPGCLATVIKHMLVEMCKLHDVERSAVVSARHGQGKLSPEHADVVWLARPPSHAVSESCRAHVRRRRRWRTPGCRQVICGGCSRRSLSRSCSRHWS